MADKILNTRILLKQAELSAWEQSTLPLKRGEVVFATVAATAGNGLTEPVVMAKVCTEEGKTFGQLPWSFYAKASDVYDWAKAEKKPEYQATEIKGLEDFIAGEIQDTNTTYSFAIVDGQLVVTPSEGEATTLDFVTPDELTAALSNYYTKGEADAKFKTKQDVVTAADNNGTKTVKISQDANGKVTVEQVDIAFPEDKDTKYGIEYDSVNKKIKLTNDTTKTEIDASDFIKDGMIESVELVNKNDKEESGQFLKITWNSDAGDAITYLDVTTLVDVYTGSEGTNIKVTVTSDKKIEADLTDAVKTTINNKKDKQTAVGNKITNSAHVLSTLLQNANGDIAYEVKELTPADIGAQAAGDYALRSEIPTEFGVMSVTANDTSGIKVDNTDPKNPKVEVDDTITWIFDCGGAE